jgi:hypothetical protein
LDLYQKLTTLACEGFFTNKAGQIIQFNERTLAALDDTCGFSDRKQLGFGSLAVFGMHRVSVLV